VHKTANILNKVALSVQANMKKDLREVYLAPSRASAEVAIDVFAERYGAKYDKAVECLTKDPDALLDICGGGGAGGSGSELQVIACSGSPVPLPGTDWSHNRVVGGVHYPVDLEAANAREPDWFPLSRLSKFDSVRLLAGTFRSQGLTCERDRWIRGNSRYLCRIFVEY
jgi:hypothetical protein